MARPLRGVGGKVRAIKVKRTFFETYFFLLPFKNKIILLLTTYRNMDMYDTSWPAVLRKVVISR